MVQLGVVLRETPLSKRCSTPQLHAHISISRLACPRHTDLLCCSSCWPATSALAEIPLRSGVCMHTNSLLRLRQQSSQLFDTPRQTMSCWQDHQHSGTQRHHCLHDVCTTLHVCLYVCPVSSLACLTVRVFHSHNLPTPSESQATST